MEKLNNLYLIKLECIDEGNSYGLNLGEQVYATQCYCGKHSFSKNPNLATIFYDKDDAIMWCKHIYSKGDFMPTLHEIIRKIGPSVDFCLEA